MQFASALVGDQPEILHEIRHHCGEVNVVVIKDHPPLFRFRDEQELVGDVRETAQFVLKFLGEIGGDTIIRSFDLQS